jgi:hypothetical protein
MSDFHAIGGVSATLQTLLKDRMELPQGVPSAHVTISAPTEPEQAAVEEARVNLFLYRVTQNGSLKNQDLSGTGHPAAYGHPPLSLDLHYLLTAYGTTSDGLFVNESRAQHLLGSAMRVLHDHPIITAQLLMVKLSPGDPVLDASLRHEFERVKVTLDPLSLEDISKVWTALTLPFRLSAAYTVSVVQIESARERHAALPVKTRRLQVAPQRRPQIEAVYRKPNPGEAIGDLRVRILDAITIEGVNFTSSATFVKVGALDPAPVVPSSDDRIEVELPDNALLQPGPQTVEVLTEQPGDVVQGGLDKGESVLGQHVQSSNQAVFMLVPSVTGVSLGANSVLTVDGSRLYHEPLRSFVIVGDVVIEVRPPTLPDPWAPPTPASVQVLVPAFAPGTPVRARVNGAESIEAVVP